MPNITLICLLFLAIFEKINAKLSEKTTQEPSDSTKKIYYYSIQIQQNNKTTNQKWENKNELTVFSYADKKTNKIIVLHGKFKNFKETIKMQERLDKNGFKQTSIFKIYEENEEIRDILPVLVIKK